MSARAATDRHRRAGTLGDVRGRRVVIGAVVLAAVTLALVAGLLGRVHLDDRVAAHPCHAQVNCAGQIANVPLGASALPVAAAVVVAAVLLVTRVAPAPAAEHDRLVAGRLFRPPRLLGRP
jgi:hypothetical protein